MKKLRFRDQKPKGIRPARREAVPRCLRGDITASRLLAAGIDSRGNSTSPLWFCPCGGMGSAGRCNVPTSPCPLGRALAPHLQGDLLSFLSCSKKDFWPWLLRFLSFPIHPQGCWPTPSQAPHAHQRAMARPADKGVFLPSGSPSSHKFSAPAWLAATKKE